MEKPVCCMKALRSHNSFEQIIYGFMQMAFIKKPLHTNKDKYSYIDKTYYIDNGEEKVVVVAVCKGQIN